MLVPTQNYCNESNLYMCVSVGSIYRAKVVQANQSSDRREGRALCVTSLLKRAHRSHNQSDPQTINWFHVRQMARVVLQQNVTFSLVFTTSYKNIEFSVEIDTIVRTNRTWARLHWFASVWLASLWHSWPRCTCVYTGSVTVRSWAESTQ